MATSKTKSTDDLNQDMHEQMAILRDDISALKSTIAEYGKAQTSHLRAVADEKVDHISQKGAAAVDELTEAANKTLADTEKAVRANPATSMGIAAGAGFLVGLLLARRN